MACVVETIVQRLADLADGLSVTASNGETFEAVTPRRAVGGSIPESPFVEVGNAALQFEDAVRSCLMTMTVDVAFYVRFGKNEDLEAEVLRLMLCAFRDRLKADPTLGSVVESARVVSSAANLIQAEGEEFWVRVVVVEVKYAEC